MGITVTKATHRVFVLNNEGGQQGEENKNLYKQVLDLEVCACVGRETKKKKKKKKKFKRDAKSVDKAGGSSAVMLGMLSRSQAFVLLLLLLDGVRKRGREQASLGRMAGHRPTGRRQVFKSHYRSKPASSEQERSAIRRAVPLSPSSPLPPPHSSLCRLAAWLTFPKKTGLWDKGTRKRFCPTADTQKKLNTFGLPLAT